jgi:Skp family chaperone for outer membrane proteins
MDNIVYTCAFPLIIGVLFGAVRHFHTLFISNTKLIIRQSDQIQFILTRVVELDKKIKRLEKELNDLNNNNDSLDTSILDTIQEEEEETLTEMMDKNSDLNEENENDDDLSQHQHVEYLTKEKEKEKENSFEIIESTPIKTQKEKGWIRYLF